MPLYRYSTVCVFRASGRASADHAHAMAVAKFQLLRLADRDVIKELTVSPLEEVDER
jgi:hypothetical protein